MLRQAAKQTMRRFAFLAAASVLLASVSVAGGQKKSGAETALLGIHLYDSGLKVVQIFGTPTTVEPVAFGTATGGSGGSAGPSNGGPMGPQGGSGTYTPPKDGHPGASSPSASVTGPEDGAFNFGDSLLQAMPGGGRGRGGPMGAPTGAGSPGGGGPMGGPGGGVPGGNSANSNDRVVFTRWVYNRAGCKYGFVMDKFNRVIQIEAIGIANAKVHTQRGITFGSTFAQVIKKYNKNPDGSANAPDGYEISGDTLVVRYLVRNKVAFRFSRLGKDKPQVVTGIAIAAGKQ